MRYKFALGAAAFTAWLTMPAQASIVTLTPARGTPDSTVQVQGSGFVAGATVLVELGNQRLGRVRATKSGQFATRVRLPAGLSPGRIDLLVRAGRRVVRNPFRIQRTVPSISSSATTSSAGPRIVLAPTSGEAGTPISLRGFGIRPRRLARVFLARSLRYELRSPSGTFRTAFPVLGGLPGARLLVVRTPRTTLRLPFRVLAPRLREPVLTAPPTAASIRVPLPYRLDFGRDHGGLPDANGTGTGFTYVAPTNGTGYLPNRLLVDTSDGMLFVTTTSGIAFRANNSLDNGLAVGAAAWEQPLTIGTTLINPPVGTGSYEQAGLWFGRDQDNYAKLVVISLRSGDTRVELLLETNGERQRWRWSPNLNLANSRVSLTMLTNPADRTVAASYSIDGQAPVKLASFLVPAELFGTPPSSDVPPVYALAGIFATNRLGQSPVVCTFDDFWVTA